MQNRKVVRNSSMGGITEQYVTVEIHNNQLKKKYKHHRDSIINQIKVTENIVEETLNKQIKKHIQSNFQPKFKDSKLNTVKRFKVRQHTEKEDNYAMSAEVKRKLQQLGNITQHFQRACQPKKKSMGVTNCSSNQGTYSLPIVIPQEQVNPPVKNGFMEMCEQKLLINEWRQKVKHGRNHVSQSRHRFPHRFKIKDLKNRTLQQQRIEEQIEVVPRSSLKSLRDIYFAQIQQERKTAPVPPNSMQFLLCQQRSRKSTLNYISSVEQQPIQKLREFIEGGEPGQLNQFTHHFNIPEFMRSKQKYKTLKKIYNHVKQNVCYELKDYSADSFDTPSLLSLVYYVENSNNLTEQQKKIMKKRLAFVD